MKNDMSQFSQSEVLLKYLNYENDFLLKRARMTGSHNQILFILKKS